MNQGETEQRMRSTRASRRRVRPTQGAGSMDAELAEMIEENLPLVKHIVFQVAVHFPRHVDRDELARAGALRGHFDVRLSPGSAGTRPGPKDLDEQFETTVKVALRRSETHIRK